MGTVRPPRYADIIETLSAQTPTGHLTVTLYRLKRPSGLLHWIEHVMRVTEDGKIRWHHTRQYGGASGPKLVAEEWKEITRTFADHSNA